ncbi:hypothetical protein KAU11_06290, partial [Candidatus Babeliales bacterium]|nr:hypothetical protein [Candidatus Babeliales bacterium]
VYGTGENPVLLKICSNVNPVWSNCTVVAQNLSNLSWSGTGNVLTASYVINITNYNNTVYGILYDDISYQNFTLNYYVSQFFDVTIFNYWKNTSISQIFNVSYDSTVVESVAGVVRIFPSESSLNLTVSADGFFTRYFLNHNTADDLNVSLKQSDIKFRATEIITDDYIYPANFTIDGVVRGVNESFYLSEGVYNVTFSKSGWFDSIKEFTVSALDNKTINVTEVSSTALNITLKKFADNATINTFSGTLYNSVYDITIPFSTTVGFVEVGVAIGQAFEVNISSSGYASTSDTVTINDSPVQNFTSYVYNFNSLRINIYNDTSTNLLLQNITVSTLWDGESMVNYTSSGSIILNFLTPDDYEIRFSTPGFLNTSLFIVVSNDSTQELNVNLPLSANKELQRFVVFDEIGDFVPGSIIRLQREVVGFTGLWQTVDEKKTNTDGETGFYVDKSTNIFYRMIVIYEGTVKLITDKTLFLPGVDDIISLQIDISDEGDAVSISEVVTTFVWSGNDNETFLFSWVDPDNSIVGGRLVITVVDYNLSGVPPSTLYDVSLDGSTGSLGYTLPVVNDTLFTVKTYIVRTSSDELVDDVPRIFGRTIIPDKVWGLLVSVLVVLFTAFITISLKPLFSGILSVVILGVLAAFQVIT